MIVNHDVWARKILVKVRYYGRSAKSWHLAGVEHSTSRREAEPLPLRLPSRIGVPRSLNGELGALYRYPLLAIGKFQCLLLVCLKDSAEIEHALLLHVFLWCSPMPLHRTVETVPC